MAGLKAFAEVVTKILAVGTDVDTTGTRVAYGVESMGDVGPVVVVRFEVPTAPDSMYRGEVATFHRYAPLGFGSDFLAQLACGMIAEVVSLVQRYGAGADAV